MPQLLRKPERLRLTESEETLFTAVLKDFAERPPYKGDAAKQLLSSLLGRKVVPKERLRYLTDSECSTGRLKCSYLEVFKRNRCEDPVGHPSFVRYLVYLIKGADLSPDIVSRFVSIIEEHIFDDYDMLTDLMSFGRSTARRAPLQSYLDEEFFKLALDCGLQPYEAKLIRRDVLTAQSAAKRK